MSADGGFRTARGVATVGKDAITIRRSPAAFLAGRRARWRDGGHRARARIALGAAGLLASAYGLRFHLPRVAESGPDASAAVYASSVAFLVYAAWAAVRDRTVPLSDVESVAVDGRTLTIIHDAGGSLLAPGGGETRLALRSDEDARSARESFRRWRISVEPAGARATETTYRVTTRRGACFCERCDAQASPSDRTCPACGYDLRVETAVATEPAGR